MLCRATSAALRRCRDCQTTRTVEGRSAAPAGRGAASGTQRSNTQTSASVGLYRSGATTVTRMVGSRERSAGTRLDVPTTPTRGGSAAHSHATASSSMSSALPAAVLMCARKRGSPAVATAQVSRWLPPAGIETDESSAAMSPLVTVSCTVRALRPKLATATKTSAVFPAGSTSNAVRATLSAGVKAECTLMSRAAPAAARHP